VLAAFAAGVLLTVALLAVVGYLVLSDQRRTARVMAVALSHTLAREVRIDRVTDVGTGRVVLRGVELPLEGGWPARIVAERVEATGPLVAAARGGMHTPVKLSVIAPAIELPAGGGAGLDLRAVESLRRTLADFVGGPGDFEASLTGGTARSASGDVEFDLALRKAGGQAHAELTLRAPRVAPLVVTLDGRQDGDTTRLSLAGRGGVDPLVAWLPAPAIAAARQRPLDVLLDVELSEARGVVARGRLGVGDALAAGGTLTIANGVLDASLPSASADLAFASAVGGLGWAATGRAELSGVSVSWRSEAGSLPTGRATVRIPRATLPPEAAGTTVAIEGLEGRVTLDAPGGKSVVGGDVRAVRMAAAGLDVAPVETRYRVALEGGRPGRIDLEGLAARIEGAALTGAAGYEAAAHRLDARLGGEDVDAAGLVRRLAPGWLAAADQLRLQGLVLRATNVDLAGLSAGGVRLEARGLRWQRAAGAVQSGRLVGRADLAGGAERRVAAALDVERLTSTLSAAPGEIARVVASADLARGGGSAEWVLRQGAATARDRQAGELLVATLQPAPTAGRFRLAARLPALARLEGLYPSVTRTVNGSARLDVELGGPGWSSADGRLTLEMPEGEMAGGKISVREVAAEVPIRRGEAFAGEPPWGRITIGELIAYGVVARDVTTPARLYRDRLSLNDLTYGLYSGEGKGWSEVELESAGLAARGQLSGDRVRIEEFIGSYGIRGGTMTGLLRYTFDYQYRAGQPGLKGQFEVPEGGAVNIELLNRLLAYAGSDPTGVVRSAVENLREFDYKTAEADVHTAGNDIRVNVSLRGRERFLIFPPRVKEINVRNLPLSFLARQFPGAF
jgi:hypothetical protein